MGQAEGRKVSPLASYLYLAHGWWLVNEWLPLVVDLSERAAKETLRPVHFRLALKKHVSALIAKVEAFADFPDGSRLISELRSAYAFLSGRDLRWETFAEQGRCLSCVSSGSPLDSIASLGQLMALGPAINAFYGHREAPSPRRFCAMCWRYVLGPGKHCRKHRVPAGGSIGQSSLVSDGYWFGRKLSQQFNDHIRVLSSQARKEKLRSQWKEAIGIARVAPWLERYRPRAWRFVVERVGKPDEASVLPAIVRALDEHGLEFGEMLEQREALHRGLADDHAAVFGLLLRAEAWLGAAAERRDGWGGSRVGAGRPVKAAVPSREP